MRLWAQIGTFCYIGETCKVVSVKGTSPWVPTVQQLLRHYWSSPFSRPCSNLEESQSTTWNLWCIRKICFQVLSFTKYETLVGISLAVLHQLCALSGSHVLSVPHNCRVDGADTGLWKSWSLAPPGWNNLSFCLEGVGRKPQVLCWKLKVLLKVLPNLLRERVCVLIVLGTCPCFP